MKLSSKISPDVDVVMSKVNTLRRLVESEYSRHEREGTKRLTLADLNIPNVKTEVLSLNDDEVRATIERVTAACVQSIISGQGFHYEVPSRGGKNQMYVPELDRIVLKDKVADRVFASIKNGRKVALTSRVLSLVYELCLKRIHVTKRDLFYTDAKLFEKQEQSDEIIEDVACMLGCTRTSLNGGKRIQPNIFTRATTLIWHYSTIFNSLRHFLVASSFCPVVASEKGIVVGRISFRDDGDFIDCTRMGVGGKAIPPSIDRVTDIQGEAKFVLLVEKDAAFMRLAEDRFYNKYPCCIITAKGQPDVATRLFLKKVKVRINIRRERGEAQQSQTSDLCVLMLNLLILRSCC